MKKKRAVARKSEDEAVEVPLVKACGFASYSPEVLVVFGAYSSSPTKDRVFSFPPLEGKPFDLPQQTKGHNYVMLMNPERLADLRPHADQIHRLLIFGTCEQLASLGVPVVDTVIKEGRVGEMLKQTVQSLQEKITTQAVDFPLRLPVRKKKKKKMVRSPETASRSSEKDEAIVVSATSLLGRLRRIKELFSGTKLEFEDTIMIPTILRLVREIKRGEFRQACAALLKYKVSEKLVDKFHTYIEEQTTSGKTLGRAARTYLWPRSGKRKALDALATTCECSLMDLKLVVVSVRRLQETVA